MSSFKKLTTGPTLSRPLTLATALAGVVLGGLSALLGTVTHSGGIEGGGVGITVALMTVLAGATAFMLLGGLTGWVSYGLGLLLTLLLVSLFTEGDGVGTIYEGLTAWWSYGAPGVLLLGVLLAWIGYLLLGQDRRDSIEEPENDWEQQKIDRGRAEEYDLQTPGGKVRFDHHDTGRGEA